MKNKIKLTNDDLDVIIPNTVENDLLYHASVLSKIENVLTKTYGPYAGYISQLISTDSYTYTKDGMLTLNAMSFHVFTDNTILGLVQLLASQIKSTSGDGATTATLFLSNLIKFAAEYIYNEDKDEVMKKRITTPKAMELLQKLIKNELESTKKKPETYQDLKDAAFIALNNDSLLMRPFIKLIDYLEEHEVPINDELKLESRFTADTEFDIAVNSGFDIPAVKPLLDATAKSMHNVKFVMIRDYISILTYEFVMKPLINSITGVGQKEIAVLLRKQNIQKVVFIVGNMDEDVADEMVNYAKDRNGDVIVDFIILTYANTNMSEIRNDLSVFLNVKETSLMPYIEKRTQLDKNHNPAIDNPNTTNLLKWKLEKLPNGQYNYMYGLENFLTEIFFPSLENGLYCNLEFTRSSMTVVPMEMADGKQKFSELYYKRIEELEDLATSEDKETKNSAKVRLSLLKTNVYYIKVPYRISDQSRIFTACSDATNAITSIAKHGYHMGGSIGLYNVIKSVINKLETKLSMVSQDNSQKSNDTKLIIETSLLILSFIKSSIYTIIKLLLPIEYRDSENYLENAIKDGFIKEDEYKFGSTRVISPIETDEVMMNIILFQFSNLFSSLMIEFPEIGHVMHVQNTVTKIKDMLNKKHNTKVKEETIIKENKKPVAITIKPDEVTPEVKEEAVVNVQPVEPKEIVPEIKEEVSTVVPEEEFRKKMIEMGFDPDNIQYHELKNLAHEPISEYPEAELKDNAQHRTIDIIEEEDGRQYSRKETIAVLDPTIKKYKTSSNLSIEMSEIEAKQRGFI